MSGSSELLWHVACLAKELGQPLSEIWGLTVGEYEDLVSRVNRDQEIQAYQARRASEAGSAGGDIIRRPVGI